MSVSTAPKTKYEDAQYGDFHVHTNYTDGRNTVSEYCQRALQNGLRVIAFPEHIKKNPTYNYHRLLSDIAKAKPEFGAIRILSGCEAKVLNIYGELDAPQDVLAQCDIVIGVFHSFKHRDKESYLAALKAMLCNPAVDIWGHPTLFTKKHNIILEEKELNEIIDVCIENGVLIERNLKYNVPDAYFTGLAVNKGAKFIIGSDAHSVEELPTMGRLKEEWDWINKMY